jgi:hypothetical protein
MPMIQGSTSTAAGQITANVLAGSVYEYLPFNAFIEIGVCDAAAGEQRVTILSGSDTLLEESPVSTQNRFPLYPDDFVFTDYAAAGERLVIKTRNTGAGANTLRWTVRLTPVG